MADPQSTASAPARWAAALESWAIPEAILAHAPESPWFHPPALFSALASSAVERGRTPTHDAVADALAAGETVLDVGVGGGAASLPVAPPAGRIVGVDENRHMLDEFARLAAAAGVSVDTVEGRWPDVAGSVEVADVVVCANVAYNVAPLDAFVVALTDKARSRVVLELTALHPQSSVSWLWKHFWDLDRPTEPSADLARAVVAEAVGIEPEVARWPRARHGAPADDPQAIAWLRRRLCLTADRDDELAELVAAHEEDGEPFVEAVTLWWPPPGR